MDITLQAPLSVRPTSAEDQSFLQSLFQASNPHLYLTGLPTETAQRLISQQFEARQQGYRLSYPHASHDIINLSQHPISQLSLNYLQHSIHITDLALTPEQQQQGYGSQVIGSLKRHVRSDQNLTLSVYLNTPRAQHLYQRLGFINPTITKSCSRCSGRHSSLAE